MRKLFPLLVSLVLTLSACSAAPTSAPTIIVEPTSPRRTASLPQTEAEVPRVTVEEAKAALDSGAAIIVDVRTTESFLNGHIAGAVSIPLPRIEQTPASVRLDKERWIITYCT